MKKGKRGWFLLMAFTTWTALIAGCGKWPGNKPDKVPEVTTAGSDTENTENPENGQVTPLLDIKELTYYVHGTMMEPIWNAKNFDEVFSELDDLTVDAENAFYRKQGMR